MYLELEDPIENDLTKMGGIMEFVKNGRILIATDINESSKTWDDVKTNSTGKKWKNT
jgi:hypothetical protein